MSQCLQAFNEVAGQLFVVESIEVVDPQGVKVAIALEEVIADHQQSVTDRYDGSFASSMSSDSLEAGGEVTIFAA